MGNHVEPIYDRSGKVVGWLKGDDIYHLNGSHASTINSRNVYGHAGQHFGVFDKGLFRDHRGGVVAFIRGAQGGPVLPIPSVPPIPPIPSIPPIPAIPSVPPVPAVPSLGWGIAWKQFIDS